MAVGTRKNSQPRRADVPESPQSLVLSGRRSSDRVRAAAWQKALGNSANRAPDATSVTAREAIGSRHRRSRDGENSHARARLAVCNWVVLRCNGFWDLGARAGEGSVLPPTLLRRTTCNCRNRCCGFGDRDSLASRCCAPQSFCLQRRKRVFCFRRSGARRDCFR